MKAVINLKALRENALAFRSLTGGKLCAVVKANAYGHGAVEVVNALCGVADCFAVALIEEAVAIKTAVCGKDILVLTPPTDEEEATVCIENGFILSLSSNRETELLKKATRGEKVARVHVKLNTGMNRYGVDKADLDDVCRRLENVHWARVEGVYSHLYSTDTLVCEKQRAAFLAGVEVVLKRFPNVTAHLSATYGTTLGKAYSFDMVRVGLGLYGYLPSGVDENVKKRLGLKRVMTVYAKPVAARIYTGGGFGYGDIQDERLLGKRIGTYRFGYADGFLRKKDNGVVGAEKNLNTLCMDACIRETDNVTLGEFEPILTDAEKTAEAVGAIAYETLCLSTVRAEMVYVYE